MADTIALLLIYAYVLTNFWLSTNTYTQLISGSSLMVFLAWMQVEYSATKKFICHVSFISVLITLVCDVVSAVYSLIFYFGFVNTVLLLNAGFMATVGGLVNSSADRVFSVLNGSQLGAFVFYCIHYYYNTYVLSKRTISWAKNLLAYVLNIIGRLLIQVYQRLRSINTELAGNDRSDLVKNKIDSQYASSKKYVIEKIVQPYFVNSFRAALRTDLFDTTAKTTKSALHPDGKNSSDIEMSFLSKKTVDNTVDDLDSDTEVTVEVPTVASGMPVEVSTSAPAPAPAVPQLSREENRALLRKRLAEKKAARQAGTTNRKALKRDLNRMQATTPGINEMMADLMKDNNLQDLLKQIPPEELTQQMPALNSQMINQFVQQMQSTKK